ncbi:MAG: fluoride efflux transporter CrcB [Acidiferrobacterales bacterium]|nr:fluoride efflux transporter CrcB [Acidiferrobacterales bacterium]
MQLLYIALGGAVGSVCRFIVSSAMMHRYGYNAGFPIGTLTVNAVGSFCIGLSFLMIQHHVAGQAAQDQLRSFVIVGLLGGFTTFSAFSLETLQLLESGLWSKALLNIILSLLVCIIAAAAGMAVARFTT